MFTILGSENAHFGAFSGPSGKHTINEKFEVKKLVKYFFLVLTLVDGLCELCVSYSEEELHG